MGNIKYCRPSDIITSLATITSSESVSTDPNYGVSALYDREPAKPLKILSPGPVRIVYDFGFARRVDAFALPNHNLNAAMVCIVSLNATNVWTAPTVSKNMTIGTQHLDGHRASPWCDLTTASGYSTGGFRYCSLYVPANTANIKLGETPIISTLRSFSQWAQFNGQRGRNRDFIEAVKTEYGVVRVKRRDLKTRAFSYTIKGSDQDFTDLQNLADDAGGFALPFFITGDSSVYTDDGLYARFTMDTVSRLMAAEEWFNVNPFNLSIEEVSRSLPL